MQIVLSAHFDVARPVPFIKLQDGKLTGLIDNFAGIFVAYHVARKTGVPLYLTNFEESGFKGARKVAKQLTTQGVARVLRAKSAGKRAFSSIATPFAYGVKNIHRERLGERSKIRADLSALPIIIVVDTTRDAGNKDGYIGNIYNLKLQKLPKSLARRLFVMPGYFEKTEDETWIYGHTFGLPTFYFGVPIPHEKDYHATDNSITLPSLNKTENVLISLVRWVKNHGGFMR